MRQNAHHVTKPIYYMHHNISNIRKMRRQAEGSKLHVHILSTDTNAYAHAEYNNPTEDVT